MSGMDGIDIGRELDMAWESDMAVCSLLPDGTAVLVVPDTCDPPSVSVRRDADGRTALIQRIGRDLIATVMDRVLL